MKKIILINLIILFIILSCTSRRSVQTDVFLHKYSDNFQWGIPSLEGQLIIREGYTLLHDGNKKVPLFVSYHLTKQNLAGITVRTNDFRSDPKISVGHRAELSDYYKSGYDRGHMAPAGDMKRNKKIMSESFYLSNMCPQKPELNRYKWRILEKKVRDYTVLEGESWVITGPVFIDINSNGNKDCLGKIGTNRIWVPTHFYKIVLTKNGEIKAISFLMPNRKLTGDIEDYQVTVDSIEKITGLNFIDKLPDEIENKIEGQKPSLDNFLISNTPLPILKKEETNKAVSGTIYHGNTKSNIFHILGCKYYNCKNCKKMFYSRKSAIKAGYRPCKICKP